MPKERKSQKNEGKEQNIIIMMKGNESGLLIIYRALVWSCERVSIPSISRIILLLHIPSAAMTFTKHDAVYIFEMHKY